jgi:hypothetical protein
MYLNNTHIYHSDTYLGEDFSDGIKHYKYIRKYQKNGHTYYVYDDSEAKRVENNISRGLNTEFVDKDGWHVTSRYEKGQPFGSGHSIFKTKILNMPQTKQSPNDRIKETLYKNSEKRLQEYSVQRLKDIPRRIHARGLSLVSGFLKWLRGD